MEPYRYPGMRDYIDSEASRLGLTDSQDNGRPVAVALRAYPLTVIDSMATQADATDPDKRAAVLDHCLHAVAALVLSLSGGLKALEACYVGHGLPVPPWVSLALLMGDDEIVSSESRKTTRKGKGD